MENPTTQLAERLTILREEVRLQHGGERGFAGVMVEIFLGLLGLLASLAARHAEREARGEGVVTEAAGFAVVGAERRDGPDAPRARGGAVGRAAVAWADDAPASYDVPAIDDAAREDCIPAEARVAMVLRTIAMAGMFAMAGLFAIVRRFAIVRTDSVVGMRRGPGVAAFIFKNRISELG